MFYATINIVLILKKNLQLTIVKEMYIRLSKPIITFSLFYVKIKFSYLKTCR